MEDHDVFAIQARGLEDRAVPDHSVRAAARRSVRAMRVVQPTGPYAIGGYSFGGFVAFEMACRLRAIGEDVAILVILDTPARIGAPSVERRVRGRLDTLRVDAPPRRLARARVVAARAASFAMKSAYAHAERRIALTSAGLVPRRGYHQYDLFLRLHTRMALEYRPTQVFDGPALVVRSPGGGQADLGWSERVNGPVTVVEVAGDHAAFLRRPTVEDVGRVVSKALADRTPEVR
jgi:thioesterase domain-containing protein